MTIDNLNDKENENQAKFNQLLRSIDVSFIALKDKINQAREFFNRNTANKIAVMNIELDMLHTRLTHALYEPEEDEIKQQQSEPLIIKIESDK